MPPDEPDGPPRVTEIKRRPRGRVAVTTSEGATLTVRAEALTLAGVGEGDLFDTERRERLEREEHRSAAHEAALRLLSYRPRSQQELGQRLRLRGIPADVIEHEMKRLQRAGLVDDEAFARSWVGDRQINSPRGQRLLRYELRTRGIETRLAEEAVDSIDDRTAALAVARGRAPRLAGLEFQQFRKKLSGFLQRRGFAYEDISHAVRTVWNETTPESERR